MRPNRYQRSARRAGVRAAVATFALLCAVLATAIPAWAQATRDFYFRPLTGERGLAQNTVTAIAQDPRGFVWVGTQGGLHRYDGQHFQLFRHDPRDRGSLPDSYVTALAVQGDDALWVGTSAEFVARIDLRDGRIERFLPREGPGPHKQVAAVLPVDGRLWVGTAGGLLRFDPKTAQAQTLLSIDPRTTVPEPYQALLRDRDNAVWYGSAAGLYRFGAGGGAERIADGIVRSLAFDRNGKLWVGRADGLFRLRDDGRALLRAWPIGDDNAAGGVRAIAQAPDRRLWFSAFGDGLRRFDPATGQVTAMRESILEGALRENTISTLLVDRGGMLWVGGQFRGPSVVDPQGTRFRYLVGGTTDDLAPGLGGHSVRAILEDGTGHWWLGTDGGSLYRTDAQGGDVQDIPTMREAMPSPSATLLRAMAFAPIGDGRAWMATTHGLAVLDTRTGAVDPVPLPGFPGVMLRTVTRAADGSVWLGSQAQGLLHYDPRSGRTEAIAPRDPSIVHAVTLDPRGRVWAGTSDGLQIYEPTTRRLQTYRHAADDPDSIAGNLVRAIHRAADGTTWIGTHSGLSRVRGDGAKLTFDHPLAAALGARPVPVVFSISESAGGVLWLGTDAGLMRFDPVHAQVRQYGMRDGLQDLEFNGGAALALRDGRLLFGGVRGLNVFDPRQMQGGPYMPPVRLLAARVGANAVSGQDLAWQRTRVDVPADAGMLRLRIGALDFADEDSIRYRYRLDGFDAGWIDNGTQNEVTYTRLPPGDYLFRAQATNRDGGWNPEMLENPIFVAAPAWRHPVAIALYVLAGLLVCGLLAWLLVQRRRRERDYFDQLQEREERLQLALWASGEMFWDYDLARGELRSMRTHEGDQRPDIAILTDVDQRHEIHEDDLPRVLERLRAHVRGESPLFLSEHRVRGHNGAWTWVRARGRVVERNSDGRAVRVAGTARDITGSRTAERERRIASEVLRSMGEAVAVLDRDFHFVSVNPAFARISGYNDTDVIGKSASLLDSTQHDPDFYRQVRAELERNGRWSGEMWQQRMDGEEFLCWIESSAVLDTVGQRSHYVAVFTDITDKKRAEQELRYLANYDTLTSLPNRALLSERLSRAIVRARRQESRIGVLFLDLDRFKDINDSLGHAAGDRILRATAARLQQTVGPQHTVARLGGDEFTVVLENLDTADEAEKIAREIITAFEAPLDIDDHQDVAITPSIGISLYPDNAQVPTDLLKHADTAMYQAKAAGRRIYMRYTESMEVAIRRRATISAALRKVLDRNELRLVFQPKLSLPQARITGVEALLRWTSPEYGEVPPAQFIPLAEESGLILEIGEWALREACRTLQRWRAHGLDRLTMAVNVSALQLLRGDLPGTVARVLEETGVPAEYLELELTESVVMSNASATAATLQAFRELGVQLAIDDFGTGYSSLAYLKRLPITTLKIDKEFIGDLTRDADDEAITSTVITMAHSLGLNVVAEGVEEEAQVMFLRAHRCDEIQGYWLSPPLDAHRCLGLIRTWAPDLDAAVTP